MITNAESGTNVNAWRGNGGGLLRELARSLAA